MDCPSCDLPILVGVCCDNCGKEYCEECIVDGLCPNCDGRAENNFDYETSD